MNKADRDSISFLSGSRNMLNMRDASAQIPIWKKDPTPITHPGSQRGNQATNQRMGYRPVPSPYDNMSSRSGRAHTRGEAYGNTTASMIVFGRRPDRLRKPNNFVQGSSNLSRHRVDPVPVIEIPDDDEDVGVPVQSDPMNIVDDDEDQPFIPPSKKSNLNIERPQHHPFGDSSQDKPHTFPEKPGSSRPKDGADTIALEKQISNQESDAIEYFTEDEHDSQGVKIQKGNVKEKIRKIEKISAPPHLDLRKPPPKATVKSKMKLKGGNRDQIATSSSFPKSSGSTYFLNASSSASTPPTKKGPPIVRVKELFLGTEHKKSDLGYFIQWDSKQGMTIREGELGHHTDLFEIAFNVQTEISSVQTMPCSPTPEPTIMEFGTFSAHLRGMKRESAAFKMGDKKAIGKITLKFDTDHRDWSNDNYTVFLKWIRSRIQKHDNLRIPSAKSVWEGATRAAEMYHAGSVRKRKTVEEFSQDARPSKRHASDSVETLSQDESTPPPVDQISVNSSKPRDSTSRPSRATIIPQPQRTRNSTPPPPDAPRRSSRKVAAAKERSPSVDPDEVILCYPQGVPGAVNINNADFKRLQPGEFLNDTLIEFGLKLWLRNLEETDPDLAKQIHVFSSFFYKKLNTRNIEDGYNSVRKWTSKFDLFSKKYIIVPINEHLHWYLAIIYHPAHILTPPLVVETQSPATRRRAQVLNAAVVPSSKPISSLVSSISATPPPAEITNKEEASSDSVSDNNLLNFNASCSITVTSERSRSATAEDVAENMSLSPLTNIDSDKSQEEILRDISPTVSDYKPGGPPATDVEMYDAGSSSTGAAEVEQLFANDMDVDHASTPSAVKPINFYGKLSKKAQGKQKEAQSDATSMAAREEEEEEASSPVPTTYIFTLDSLGSRHPQAIKQLSKYLKLEAKDKHNLSETSDPCGKMASVPVQPNFCDCGLYLLHFAQKFVTDPEKYCRIINTRTKNPSMEARQEAWEGSKISTMREDMANDILKLSAEWKKAKEEARKKEEGTNVFEVIESTDDEVDIVETVSAPGKGRGKGKGAAAPKRGPANRLR